MEFTQNCMDIAAFREQQYPVRDVIKRGPGDIWLVLSAVRDEAPLQWGRSLKGEHVMIPLIPYLLPDTHLQDLPFGIQLAARACDSLRSSRIRRIHISYGSEFTEAPDQSDLVRHYVGLAVLVER